MGASNTKGSNAVLRPGAEWVNDEHFTRCYRCREQFTMSRRRHHCRMCGAVYCSACCPDAEKEEPDRVRRNPSMPQFQRHAARLCLSCRLPAWMLPLSVDRLDRFARPGAGGGGRRPGGSPTSRSSEGSRPVLKDLLTPTIDGTIMVTIFEFLSTRGRTALIQTHPAIRHCLPVPPIKLPNGQFLPLRFKESVAFVYPGVVAPGDGSYSGGFRAGMKGLFGGTPAQLAHRNQEAAAHVGTGGGGSVYYALDRERNCFVCVKLVSKCFDNGSEQQIQFHYDRTFASIEKEIAIQKGLNNPRIAPLHDVFQTRGHVVMVCDAGEGRTARSAAVEVRQHDAKRSGGALPSIVPFTLRVIKGVTMALQYMAEQGYVHRDVKLDNVILSRDYANVRIIDFGLAERITESAGNGKGLYAPLGTPSYLSPENIRAVVRRNRRFAATRREILSCDVFSLGVMAYMMLSNKRVHGQRPEFPQMLRRCEEGIRCGGDDWAAVPTSVCRLVESMLAPTPDRRPTFEEILNHHTLIDYAAEMNAVVSDRYDRITQTEVELHDRWDMVVDANDDSDEEPDYGPPVSSPPTVAAASSASSSGGKTGGIGKAAGGGAGQALAGPDAVSVVVCKDLETEEVGDDLTAEERKKVSALLQTAENRAGERSTRYNVGGATEGDERIE